MKKVVDVAKAISGKKKIPLYLSESEIRRLDREEAVEEGIQQGIEQKQTEMILNFYNNNVPIDIISKSSGLTVEEVENIIYSKNKEE